MIALCLTLACSFGVASCSSDSTGSDKPSAPASSPAASESASGSASASPDDSATASAIIPDGAKADTENGAQAFASFWVDTLNSATESGNTTELRSLAGPDCSRCEDFAKSLDQIYGAGGHVSTKGWQVTSVIPVSGSSDDKPGFQVTVEVSPQKVFPSSGAKGKKYEGGKQGFQMYLAREDDHWVVDHINI
jgi:hypothetical protein